MRETTEFRHLPGVDLYLWLRLVLAAVLATLATHWAVWWSVPWLTPRLGYGPAIVATEGTVVAVTHDRWFARGFDRFLVFGADGRVYESNEPVWDEGRVVRPR